MPLSVRIVFEELDTAQHTDREKGTLHGRLVRQDRIPH